MKKQKIGLRLGVILALLVAAGAAYYFLVWQRPQPAGREAVTAPAVKEPPEGERIEPINVELDKSDELVRKLVGGLSSHPELARWLMTDNVIRKFVAAVDNIAIGVSPRKQVDTVSPEGDFKVIKADGKFFIDPASYGRYDRVAQVIASLDARGLVTLYRQLTPSIKEAYRDLGYPEGNFDATLHKAFSELLRVPVVEKRIEVEKGVLVYKMVDPDLERLSPAQKHLLRMGPDNVRLIQAKLQEIATGLGYRD